MKRMMILQGMITAVVAAAMIGCEDPVPSDYEPQYIVESYQVVDEPIGRVVLTRSLPPLDSFKLSESIVKDADVRIIVGGRTLNLEYREMEEDGERGAYYYPDTTEKVQPETLYRLEVRTADGQTVIGQTKTPERIEWIQAPKDTVQYPSDTDQLLNPPDSLGLSWTAAAGVVEYLISVECLDTLEYGKYLPAPTEEENLRIDRPFSENNPRYDDVTQWGFLQSTRTPISWYAFKWYGPQEVIVWAPDPNLLNWYKQIYFSNNEYNDRLGSIDNGIGVFGSASAARQPVFVLKEKEG